MKKYALYLKIIILSSFLCSSSLAQTFDQELSKLNSLNDVSKCLKNHLKPMGEKDARTYCIKEI